MGAPLLANNDKAFSRCFSALTFDALVRDTVSDTVGWHAQIGMKQKIMPTQNWIRVADGIYRRSSGTLYERPIINHRPTWRSLGTKNLKLAREELRKRRIKGEASYVPQPTIV